MIFIDRFVKHMSCYNGNYNLEALEIQCIGMEMYFLHFAGLIVCNFLDANFTNFLLGSGACIYSLQFLLLFLYVIFLQII